MLCFILTQRASQGATMLTCPVQSYDTNVQKQICMYYPVITSTSVIRRKKNGDWFIYLKFLAHGNLKTLMKTYGNVLKPSNPAYTIAIAHEQILQKKWLSLYFTVCIRLAWYCSKMYSRHLFSYLRRIAQALTVLAKSLTQ